MGTPRYKLVGEPTVYVVPKKKIFTIPDTLDSDCVFFLECASLVPYDGYNLYCALWPQKEFIPSFDKEKEKTTLINSWASRQPAELARVKIYGEINIQTGEVSVAGSGFEFVVIHMYHKKKEEK